MNRTLPRLVIDEIMLTRLLVALIRTTGVFPLGAFGIVSIVLDAGLITPVNLGLFLFCAGLNSAKGTLNFRIDLYNDSEDTSQEIESIYFYAGNNWKIQQGDTACEQGESDIPEFKHLYFLRTPQAKIPRKSWLPLRFSASRTLDSSWDERPLEDSYDVKGRALLRLATSNGIFDHEISIDVKCEYDDIPF